MSGSVELIIELCMGKMQKLVTQIVTSNRGATGSRIGTKHTQMQV